MKIDDYKDIEKLFKSLKPDEKMAIITHGMAFYLSSLKKRLFFTEAKMIEFEKKYNTTLNQIESKGLPDDANIEMHEDYIMWHHWHNLGSKLKDKILTLKATEMIGLSPAEAFNVSG